MLFLLVISSLEGQVPFVKARDFIPLDDWTFKKGIIYQAEKPDFDALKWEQVNVPHTYSMDAITDVGYYRGNAWYRTNVTLPESMKGERIYIRFEGVGQEAEVFVNGKRIGEHSGGYSAFCFEITNKISYDTENLIAVNVTNEPDFKRIPVDDKLFNHYGGIYRPVQIFSTPAVNIDPAYHASSGVFIEAKEVNIDLARLEIRTHLSAPIQPDKEVTLMYTIKEASGKVVWNENVTMTIIREDVITQAVDLVKPKLWEGLKNPHLYTLEVQVFVGDQEDKVIQTFGIKTYTVHPAKGSFLNGKPYQVNGVALHQEWEECGPALSHFQIEKDMELIEEIGASAIRLSHYQHADLRYQLADQLGILVWSEIPFVHDYSGREGANARQQLTELILQNYNHPSVFVWGLWNEVRAYSSPAEPCVVLTKDLNELAHKLDPKRLTASASDRGLISNMGNITDLQAWNKYFGWYYGEYEDMVTWLDDSRQQYPDIALGLSEYGIGGNIYQQDISRLEKPSGNYFPETEQTKYHELTWKIIQERPYLWCSFVWNMFDFSVAGWNRGGIPNLNHKGLVTYDRSVKKDAFYLYKANWSNEPMVHITEKRNDQRMTDVIDVKVYTNQSKVVLYVNGKKTATKTLSSENNVIIFTGVKLVSGENKLEVKAGRQLSDTTTLRYDHE